MNERVAWVAGNKTSGAIRATSPEGGALPHVAPLSASNRSDADILAIIQRAYAEASAGDALQADHDGWAAVMWFFMDWIVARLGDRDVLIREHIADNKAGRNGLACAADALAELGLAHPYCKYCGFALSSENPPDCQWRRVHSWFRGEHQAAYDALCTAIRTEGLTLSSGGNP